MVCAGRKAPYAYWKVQYEFYKVFLTIEGLKGHPGLAVKENKHTKKKTCIKNWTIHKTYC